MLKEISPKRLAQLAVLGLAVVAASGCADAQTAQVSHKADTAPASPANLGPKPPDPNELPEVNVVTNGEVTQVDGLDMGDVQFPYTGAESAHFIVDKSRDAVVMCVSYNPKQVPPEAPTIGIASRFFPFETTPDGPALFDPNEEHQLMKWGINKVGDKVGNSVNCDVHKLSLIKGKFGVVFPPGYVQYNGRPAPFSMWKLGFKLVD